MNTNHESVAYRSFSPSKFEARGARKVTTGIDTSLSVVPESDIIISKSRLSGNAPGSVNVYHDNTEVIGLKNQHSNAR